MEVDKNKGVVKDEKTFQTPALTLRAITKKKDNNV